jgi:CRP-like cAMP-binding protein
MRGRDSVDAGLTRTTLSIPAVRRVVGAFAAITVAEWVLGTTVAVHAYDVGGALLVGLVGFRFLPAAVAGLLTAQFAETHRRARVMTATALARTLLSGLAAGALALGLPFAIPLIAVWLDSIAGSAYRPAQATLLPTLVHSPGEFAAATALTSHAKSSGQMFGALAGGILVASVPIATAVSASTALYALGAIATVGLASAAPAASAHLGLRGRIARMRDGAAAIADDREAKEIVAYSCVRSMVRGLWMSLGVVASLELLGLGKAGFGVLMAAAGAGALLAIPVSALLVGRRMLAHWLAGALGGCGVLIAAIGGAVAGVPAIAFMVGWGMGMALSDVAGQAVLFRIIPPASIGRVTGLMESGKLVFEGAASMLAPAAVVVFGIRGALIFAGAVIALVVAAGAPAFGRMDRRAASRLETLRLISGVELFRGLRVDLLEGAVARLTRMVVPVGADVTTQGVRDEGGWYLVDRGRLAVLVDGFAVNELHRGDSFGELALLRDRPRAATVRTLSEVELLALGRDDFLSAIGGGDIEVHAEEAAAARGGETPVELLARTPLLQGLGRHAAAELAARSGRRAVGAGEPIVTEGELEDTYYVLRSGRAQVSVAGEVRRELLLGDGFGEIAVLHRVPRSATVVAVEDCNLLTVAGEDLRHLLAARGGMIGDLANEAPNTIRDQPIRGRGDSDPTLELEEEGLV